MVDRCAANEAAHLLEAVVGSKAVADAGPMTREFQTVDVAEISKTMSCGLRSLPADVDPAQFMLTIAMNESIHDRNRPGVLICPPRFELSYFYGGRYCDSEQSGYCDRWGASAAKSYGPWQVMLYEMHGAFAPSEFARLEICAQAFLSFINHRFPRLQPRTLEEAFMTYNHGTFHGPIPPSTVEYVRRGTQWYNAKLF